MDKNNHRVYLTLPKVVTIKDSYYESDKLNCTVMTNCFLYSPLACFTHCHTQAKLKGKGPSPTWAAIKSLFSFLDSYWPRRLVYATRGGVCMCSWPLLLPTFYLSFFLLLLRLLLLTQFGETPKAENLLPTIFWHN